MQPVQEGHVVGMLKGKLHINGAEYVLNKDRINRPEAAGSFIHKSADSESRMPDYAVYRFSRPEFFKNLGIFIMLDALIATLFYRSVIAFLMFLPAAYPYLKLRKKALLQQQKREMLSEFTTGMQLVNASLQAGYAVENAFREAAVELGKIYPDDSFIIREFRYMLAQMRLSVPVEKILTDLGRRTHVEDIRDMAEVFQTAKRTGGDMIAVIRGAVTSIQAKKETTDEIEANLSGKASEQRILSVAPLGIIAYISVTSPGYLNLCYHSTAGVTVMTAALAIYAAAYLWGKRILRIEA